MEYDDFDPAEQDVLMKIKRMLALVSRVACAGAEAAIGTSNVGSWAAACRVIDPKLEPISDFHLVTIMKGAVAAHMALEDGIVKGPIDA
jgi:energy-converting hydrogenase Eha subunit H